jgi:hypothetical protein
MVIIGRVFEIAIHLACRKLFEFSNRTRVGSIATQRTAICDRLIHEGSAYGLQRILFFAFYGKVGKGSPSRQSIRVVEFFIGKVSVLPFRDIRFIQIGRFCALGICGSGISRSSNKPEGVGGIPILYAGLRIDLACGIAVPTRFLVGAIGNGCRCDRDTGIGLTGIRGRIPSSTGCTICFPRNTRICCQISK